MYYFFGWSCLSISHLFDQSLFSLVFSFKGIETCIVSHGCLPPFIISASVSYDFGLFLKDCCLLFGIIFSSFEENSDNLTVLQIVDDTEASI